MDAIFRTYGKSLSLLFLLLVAVWVSIMIVVPAFRMAERAFTYEDRGSDAAMLSLEIEREYIAKMDLEKRIKALSSSEQKEPTTDVGIGVPSVMTPTAPALPQPMLTPSASSAEPQQALSAKEREVTRVQLQEQLTAIEASIVALEEKERQTTTTAGVDNVYSLKNFTEMSDIHVQIFVMTLLYASLVSVLAFLTCYPVAYYAALVASKERLTLLLVGLLVPYAINELLRIFSWVMILEKQGLLNQIFNLLGIIDLEAGEGLRFVASNGAVFVVMVYAYMLFMFFPMYNTIETLDKAQIEAAKDLGASSWKIHTRVVIPHAKPGIAVGAIMTFMLSAGSIAAPEIVGRGLHPDWFSQVIYRRFFEADSWNSGSAYSLALLIACFVFIFIIMKLFNVGIRDIAK